MIVVWEPKEEKQAFAFFLTPPPQGVTFSKILWQHHYKRSCASGTLFEA